MFAKPIVTGLSPLSVSHYECQRLGRMLNREARMQGDTLRVTASEDFTRGVQVLSVYRLSDRWSRYSVSEVRLFSVDVPDRMDDAVFVGELTTQVLAVLALEGV